MCFGSQNVHCKGDMESMRSIRNKKLQFSNHFWALTFFIFYFFSVGVIYQLIYLNKLYYYYTYLCVCACVCVCVWILFSY